MKRKIVFILVCGETTKEAETTFEPFLFGNKEMVSFESGQKAFIFKDEENIKWKYVK